MVVIHREAGLRFVIFVNDHQPAHVHVFGDGEAKVDLGSARGGASLLSCVGLSDADLRRALRIITDRRLEFLARWNAIHG
jgi:hypothetical protein